MLERYAGMFPPCHYGTDRCPKVSPEAGLALTEQNLQAFQHYQECRAVAGFPDDAIVRENAAAIRRLEDQVEKLDQQKFLLTILRAAGR
jgi:hypothetical protein